MVVRNSPFKLTSAAVLKSQSILRGRKFPSYLRHIERSWQLVGGLLLFVAATSYGEETLSLKKFHLKSERLRSTFTFLLISVRRIDLVWATIEVSIEMFDGLLVSAPWRPLARVSLLYASKCCRVQP